LGQKRAEGYSAHTRAHVRQEVAAVEQVAAEERLGTVAHGYLAFFARTRMLGGQRQQNETAYAGIGT
jgi:hypothetical protein